MSKETHNLTFTEACILAEKHGGEVKRSHWIVWRELEDVSKVPLQVVDIIQKDWVYRDKIEPPVGGLTFAEALVMTAEKGGRFTSFDNAVDTSAGYFFKSDGKFAYRYFDGDVFDEELVRSSFSDTRDNFTWHPPND